MTNTDTHTTFIDLTSGDEYVATSDGYANIDDQDFSWPQDQFDRNNAHLVATNTLTPAELDRLRTHRARRDGELDDED